MGCKNVFRKEKKVVVEKPLTPNRIDFKENKDYYALESYSTFTNWTLKDFVTILLSTNKLQFPVTVISSDENDFNCQDAAGTKFMFTLKYSLIESRTVFTLAVGVETFTYSLKNKLSPKDVPELSLLTYKKVVNNKKYGITISRNLLEVELMMLENQTKFYNIKIRLVGSRQIELLEKFVESMNVEDVFENVNTASDLFKNFTKKFDLTAETLKRLDVCATLSENEQIYSKVSLLKNQVVEYTITNEYGTFYFSKDGAVSFKTLDSNITITIENLVDVVTKVPDFITNFSEIVTFANGVLDKLNNNTLL